MGIIQNYLLFNHTYLRQLQQDKSYDEAASDAARGVREWYGFRDTSSTEELVSSWVGPMLSILELDLQPLDDQDPRTHLVYSAYDRDQPLALCYVTLPGADLDTTTKGEHWMAQAVIAARRWRRDEENDTALRWVILTNGDLWRLLDAQALRRYEAYLQVDLGELAKHGADITAIRIFYHCFHRHAFVADANGRTGLEKLLKASEAATERAEKHLRARVSHNEGIMAQLSMGLVQATGQSHFNEEERDAIFRDATYLLYRMLFILYAEARGLLPVEKQAYKEVALDQLVERAYRYQTEGMPDPQGTTLWQGLQRLFQAIDTGDERLGVPAYNGGLFDDEDKPYLSGGFIADTFLAKAMVDLVYLKNGRGEDDRIDYRDLSVRHLGSLYEGMIEYKLFIAEEPMLARRDSKGNVRFLSQVEAGGLRKNDQEIQQGQVYFAQSSGERRATGTYYTPEYIVHYIVENTVWKGLAERRQEALDKKLAEWLQELAGVSPDQRERFQHTIDQELVDFIDREVLTFRVCDPAMGSGHFLVNTAHQMTAFIVETLHLTEWQNTELATDPIIWRRGVTESCLYGVDLSHMAVELAKLSLWIATLAQEKPLGFLDHHLRQGNSVIGAELNDLVEVLRSSSRPPSRNEQKQLEAGQLTMLDRMAFQEQVGVAADMMKHISQSVSESLADIRAQSAEYAEVREALAPFRRLADMVVARHFGVEAGQKELQAVAKYLTSGSVVPVPQYERLLEAAEAQQAEYGFFHWQLEFPDVFFGHLGEAEELEETGETNSGFDAVLGNPPYVRQEEITDLKTFLAHGYASIYQGTADLYVFFIFRGFDLLGKSGQLSYIVTNKWFRASYGHKLRSYLGKKSRVRQILDFGHAPVFENVDVFPCIMILGKSVSRRERDLASDTQLAIIPRYIVEQQNLSDYVVNKSYFVSSSRFGPTSWSLERDEVEELYRKITEDSVSLAEFTGQKPYFGIKTGRDQVFVVNNQTRETLIKEDPRSSELLRPCLRGRDIKRWQTERSELWMIFSRRNSVELEAYPAIARYLEAHKGELRPMPKDWAGKQWPGRKPGLYEWYEIQDPVAYWPYFEIPKIVYQKIQYHPRYALDKAGYFPNSSVFIIPTDDLYVLAVLNSPLMWWYNWRYLPHMKDEALYPRADLMESLPLAVPNPEMRNLVEVRVNDILTFVREVQDTSRSMLSWLESEFGLQTPGTKLESFAELNLDGFVQEVTQRTPISSGDLTLAQRQELETAYSEFAPYVQAKEREMRRTEWEIAQLVYNIYGLSSEDVRWLWKTAPPRMPVEGPQA